MTQRINKGADRDLSMNNYKGASLSLLVLAFPFLVVVAVLGDFNGHIGTRLILLIIGACLFVAGIAFLFVKKEEEKGCQTGNLCS